MSAPEKEIDLLTTLLVMAKESNPNLNLIRIHQEIQNIVSAIETKKKVWENQKTSIFPEEIIHIINHHFFEVLNLQLDDSAQKQNNLENLLIDQILENRKGYCLSFCSLYLIVAEKMNLPIYGVSVPGHFFVRYDNGVAQINIESTVKGASYPDSYYKERYKLKEEDIERGLYLCNLRKKETVVEFLNNRGNCYFRMGEIDLSERDFNRAVSHSVNFAAGYTSKAFLALRKGELKEAFSHIQASLGIDPESKMALLLMAELQMKLNNFNCAEEYLLKVLEKDIENALAHTNLGLIYARRGQLKKSVEAHQKALFLDPRSLYAHNNLGATYYRLKQYEESLAEFNYVLKINPRFFPAMHNIIRTLKGAGMIELAKARKEDLICYYENLLNKEPQNDRYLFEMAKLYKEDQEDAGEALKLIQKALSIRPYYPDYVEMLAECYAMRGESLKAFETLKFFLDRPEEKYLYDRKGMEEKVAKYIK
jgi:tetratricopeptide (TPR) repeat protein